MADSIHISLVDDPSDFEAIFAAEMAAFAVQAQDNIWRSAHPGWEDPSTTPGFVQNRVRRWRMTTFDVHDNPNALFLKAVIPSPDGGGGADRIVGTATWVQLAADASLGDVPLDDATQLRAWRRVYPDSDADARFVAQALGSMQANRRATAAEKAGTAQPAWMVLDLCAVHPDFQGRGVARRLVQWGLDEARRRGGLECTTEASPMGRRVYDKLGFARGPEIEYFVDEDLKDRPIPSNMFMRTGGFS